MHQILMELTTGFDRFKPTISFNFADSKILDIVRAPYDFKTFCSSNHKSNGHRAAVSSEMPGVHFSVQKYTGRRQAGHLAATRQDPHEHLSDFVQPSNYPSTSGRRTVYIIICLQPFVKNKLFS